MAGKNKKGGTGSKKSKGTVKRGAVLDTIPPPPKRPLKKNKK